MARISSSLLFLGALGALGVVYVVSASAEAQGDTPKPREPAASTAAIVVIATPHGTSVTSSDVRRTAGGAPTAILGTIGHPADAVLRGASSSNGKVAFIVADQEAGDFGAHLFRADGTATDVGSGILHASRPLVAESGRVYVERGREGDAKSTARGKMRTDELSIDEVSTSDRGPRFRTVYASPCYALHLAGEWRGNLVVYRVAEDGASIVLVPTPDANANATVRTVRSVLPYARDFSISGDKLYASNRHETDSNRWIVTELSLETGASRILDERSGEAAAPLALPSSVLFLSHERNGLVEIARDGSEWKGQKASVSASGALGYYQPLVGSDRDLVFSFANPRGEEHVWLYDRTKQKASRLGSEHERIELVHLEGSSGGGAR